MIVSRVQPNQIYIYIYLYIYRGYIYINIYIYRCPQTKLEPANGLASPEGLCECLPSPHIRRLARAQLLPGLSNTLKRCYSLMLLTHFTNVWKVLNVKQYPCLTIITTHSKDHQLLWPVQAIFDAGNPVASIGSTLLVTLWCPEVERMAALPPQVPLIAIAQGWSKDLSWVFKSCLDSGLTIRCNQNCDLA